MRLLKKDPVLFFTLVIDEIWDELRTQGEFTLRSWGAIAGKDLVCYGTVSDYVFFHNKKIGASKFQHRIARQALIPSVQATNSIRLQGYRMG